MSFTYHSDKTVLRSFGRDARRAWRDRGALVVNTAHAAMLGALRALPELRQPVTVAGFAPLSDEIDGLFLLRGLAEDGHRSALPRMQGRAAPLRFHAWQDGEALLNGPFKVREPAAEAPVVIPDLVLVPLLAFDARGHRLGYGAGFYDRTLAALRAQGHVVTAIGIAISAQQVAHVPNAPHDVPLDAVVTERGTIMPIKNATTSAPPTGIAGAHA